MWICIEICQTVCLFLGNLKEGIIHVGIGKLSFEADKIIENFNTFMDAIIKAKPNSLKGKYVKKVSISSTMGPGLKLDVEHN